jgi:hypothetical protein
MLIARDLADANETKADRCIRRQFGSPTRIYFYLIYMLSIRNAACYQPASREDGTRKLEGYKVTLAGTGTA